jgi:hypothetical protein
MPGEKDDDGALHRVEFHFQEGFTGQTFEILVAGKLRASVTARTRFQTGLAHIEPVMLHDQEEVIIRQQDTGAQQKVHLHLGRPFVTLTLVNGTLKIDDRDQTPGYL